MKINLGPYDRILRIVIGGAVIIGGLVSWSWWAFLGLIPLVTAFVGYCPLYSPLHLNTCPPNSKPTPPPADAIHTVSRKCV